MKTVGDLTRVEDKDHLKAIIYENLHRFARWETNCIFEPGEVDRLLRRGSLYAGSSGSGAYLLDDEGDYYRVHFFFSVDDPVDFEPMDKPVLVEFLVTRGERSEATEKMEKKWMDAGFRPHVVDLKMHLPLKDYAPTPTVVENEAGQFVGRLAVEEDADQILPIWGSALDRLNSAIPGRDELIYEIEMGNIFVMDRDGEVAAANKMVIRGGMVSTWLGAVKPEYRRMGLSTAMKQMIYKTAIDRGIRMCYTWVDKENTASVKALEKIGFRCHGEWTEGFIL
ncbi:MAG: GNAT family N-acetyltransferase, partial [Clostridiales bacterium]|nr:GNAT family N-acetyltransferase [Clostridiales bacterium]